MYNLLDDGFNYFFAMHCIILQTYIELRNLSSVSRRMQILPPKTAHFAVSLGK